MMRTSILLLLLVTAFVPTIVAASPVFHCRTTGSESFVMVCCDGDASESEEAAPRSCCSRDDATDFTEVAPRGNDRGDAGHQFSAEPTICTCCDVSFIRLVTLDPRSESIDVSALTEQLLTEAAPAWISLPAAPLTLLPPDQLSRRRAPPAAVEPPLPILHAALRL